MAMRQCRHTHTLLLAVRELFAAVCLLLCLLFVFHAGPEHSAPAAQHHAPPNVCCPLTKPSNPALTQPCNTTGLTLLAGGTMAVTPSAPSSSLGPMTPST